MRSLILLVVVAACSPDARAQPAPAETPPPTVIGPRDHHPVGAIHIPCTVQADVQATVSATQVRAKLVLRNLARSATTVTLRSSCPGGPIALLGLPDDFDPMHGCQKRCSTETSTVTYKIPARGTLKLADTLLKAKGDACNPPLPLGSMFLRAELVTEPHQLGVCSGAGVHVVRDHKTKRLRRASLIAPAIPAVVPAPTAPVLAPKTPVPAPQPVKRPCPVCAFGCTNGGVPSSRTDENGCRVCACDRPGL